uniref:Cilia- and flagella-associated protein 58 central coiled coil domain-containing protein n=1 Tax=Percolomonas cosmopolitus TaxID=63605 RepID=A0A7S1KQT3_9EUKA|mmetsp:Transcript_4923/g.18528  ORF Transcript_4923/g.18528 Transcript_4923/m.18528 type:complete len:953 (+) Transcript_4923:272-3130(+)|eukprot:CAMPEP_0117450112 /NCGR_PEP_ID=MMETSP0759-20121206/8296_1 /TAXON_ID=63605 /ORGANISM="Percolomonas cosmopolitus, Strain WS" /LENGTH=952 /DNA_ID=CAMNT_0005242615 /DNA_START=254 /DNA_END=3112 /DNA_ORIENTATION=+
MSQYVSNDPTPEDVFHDDSADEDSENGDDLSYLTQQDDIIDQKVLTLLNHAIKNTKLSEKKLQYYITEFKELHRTYKETEQRESELLEKNQEMYKDLMTQKEKMKSLQREKQQRLSLMSDLRRELTKAEHQLSLAQEQDSDNQMSIIEEERAIQKMEKEVKRRKDEREEKERPIIEAYNNDIERLKQEIDEFKRNFEKHKDQREESLKKVDEMQQMLHKMQLEYRIFSEKFDLIKDEPGRAKKQADIVARALNNAKIDLEKKSEEIKDMALVINDDEKQKKTLTNTTYQMFMLEEHELKKIINFDKEIKKFKIALNQELYTYKQVNAKIWQLQQDLNQKKKALQEQSDLLRMKKKDEEKHFKQIHQIQSNIKTLERNIEKQQVKENEMQDEKETLERSIVKSQQDLEELDRDVDLMIHEFLNDEQVNKGVRDKVNEKQQEVKRLEMTITQLSDQEKETTKKIETLSTEREKMARDSAMAKQKFVETMNDIKVTNFVNAELRKNLTEIEQKNKQLMKMYSLMKQDRNKYAKSIQENAQTLAQLMDNKKILDNEHEVLSKKSLEKEKQLIKVRRHHEEVANVREQLRSEQSKLEMKVRALQDEIGENNNEIAKLNTVITLTEDEMLDLKSQYENRVQERNFTGIQLIDRNDELCILYEKSNIQENIIKNGEVELRKRKKETDLLTVELENVQRGLTVLYKQLPDLKAYLKEKASLDLQIERAQEIAEEYSKDLENPENEERWRKLGGEIPEEDVLQEQIQQIDEQLNAKKEMLMEKNLVLQEITKSSDKLRKLAITGRDHTFDLSLGLNQIQAKIRTQNRKMMSTLSELSVYQATSMTLEAKNKQLEIHIDKCNDRLKTGEPPSEEMEWQWQKEQELMQRRREALRNRKVEMQQVAEMPATVSRTTALQRPNSYIPDDELGIPKPYGAHQPFMFAEPGANMRHYRKPANKEIVY